MIYNIYMDGKPAGTAQAERQGLYYCITASCAAPGRRLRVICGEHREDLGLLVPNGQIKARLPVRKIGEGDLCFEAVLPIQEVFYPIDPEEPYEHLQTLMHSRFAVVDGQPSSTGISKSSSAPSVG